MSKYFLIICILLIETNQALAGCEGVDITGLKPGERVFSMQLATPDGNKWAMDDDGFVVLSLAAAYCNRDLKRNISIDFPEDKRECIRSAQKGMDKNDLSFNYFGPEYINGVNKYKQALDLINAKCDYDPEAQWQNANDSENRKPLDCSGSLEPIRAAVTKAVNRASQYTREQSEPGYLAKLSATAEQKREFVEKLKKDEQYAQELQTLLSKTPPNVGEFKQWVDKLKPIADKHSYNFHRDPEAPFDPNAQVRLTDILKQIQAPLPFSRNKLRCGGPVVDFLKVIENADWKSRGTPGGGSGSAPGAI